jgi:MFS family permease
MKKGAVRSSLKASFWDGVFASCMQGLTTEYITPYALALRATVVQVGILTAVPNMAASVFQIATAWLAGRWGRKNVIAFFVFLQALSGIPIVLIPLVFKSGPVTALILFVTFFVTFNALATPVWQSMMSDYLPRTKRGTYFGWRSKVLGIVSISCLFIAGIILHLSHSRLLFGFYLVFSLATFCRFISWYFLTQMQEPPVHLRRDSYFSFWDFIRSWRRSNFAKFVLFVSCLIFCVNMAAPFFSVFMLRDLKFNYITYTVLIAAVSVMTILTINRWGLLADRIGNLKVLKTTAVCIAGLPLFWLINRHPLFLLCVQLFGGFAWAGFNLCVINFIYDAVTPAKRTRCLAYFTFFNGLAVCGGSLLGGFLAQNLPALLGWRLLSLFLFSSLLRFAVVFFLGRKVREVRPVERMRTRDLFYNVVGLQTILDFRKPMEER